MACNDLQPMKHLPLIFVTELGMLMACSEVQPSKAHHPISVTESGMSTACSEEFPAKAASPISVTEMGMEYVFILPFAGNCNRAYWYLSNNIPSIEKKYSLSSATLIACKAVQSWKAYFPISFTELGMSMDCREVHPLKALLPIMVTKSGMLMVCREYNFWKNHSRCRLLS